MKKNVGVICLALLGFITSPSVSEAATASPARNGIMTSEYIKQKDAEKQQRAEEAKRAALPREMEIDIKSVDIIKCEEDIGEIFIPNDDVADVTMLSSRTLYLTGKAAGTTSLKIHGKNGNVLRDLTIRVTYPKKDIKNAIAKIYPSLDIELHAVEDNLIVKGRVDSPEMAQDVMDVVGRFVEAAKLINKLTIATATQVLLKVKIAEVTRDITKSLGISWRALDISSIGSGLIGMSMGDGDANMPPFVQDLTAAKTELLKNDGMFQGVAGGRWLVGAGINNLTALIDALANESLATVLAEPNLVALSGNEATFNSGGEKGYYVTQPNSNSQTTEFKKWGTSIKFTPVVISEDRINIKVSTEVSTVEESIDKDMAPSLSSKTVETVVELGSGQSLALAGLLQTRKSANTNETPLLAEIPVLGPLFKYSKVTSEERELVIIVTPYIVKPASKALKIPTDMVPKIMSPLKINTKRSFTTIDKKADGAGFLLK